jgi:long-chain acyl-CoA synthetase
MTMTADAAVGVTTRATRLRDWAERDPERIAIREKRLGVWREITYRDYWREVQLVAHAMLSLGIDPGDRVAIHSLNRTEWLFLDVACTAIRAASMGLYPTNPSAEVQYLLANSGSSMLIVEDQEQLDKVLAVIDELPALRKIVYLEPRGIEGRYQDHRLLSWAQFVELGLEHQEQEPHAVGRRMAEAQASDLATLVYTSGTTGPPKGAMLSVENINFAATIGSGDGLVSPPPGPNDMVISYLPLCHAYERGFSVWFALESGLVVNFAESIETITTDLREVQPTIFQSVPRIYEKMYAAVLVRAASASRLKRLNYGVWTRVADWIGRTLERTGGRHTVATRLAYRVGWLFLYRALQERLGLRRCRHAISAAAPIAPEILRFFMGIGVPIFEAYGMTENSLIATTNRRHRVRLGTVGEVFEGTEIRIDADTGEIQSRHPGVFVGYWNRPDATAETMTEDGWLRTGDVGEWVEGSHIRIVDRMKDIIITAGGKNISPSEIENSLKTSPFINEAVVIGDRRKYLSALIAIDFDVVSSWAQAKGIPHTTFEDLSAKPEVVRLVQKAVDETNEKFASVEQVKRFTLFPKELDEEDGELTATQKVKRKAIEKAFSDLIESMY